MRLPERVSIIEVGPRDGFQSVSDFISTKDKLNIITLLNNAGISAAEVTSFVHPKIMPQMADAQIIAKKIIDDIPNLRAIALVPNEKGAENAQACGINEVSFVISASEAHNQANVKRSVSESLEELKRIRSSFPKVKVRLDVATAFGCPYEGTIQLSGVYRLIDCAVGMNIQEIVLCDTIGIANPLQVGKYAENVRNRYKGILFTMHLHNTRGQGLANIYSALLHGIHSFETSAGGMGGCPFAPGAAGNVATEDLVNMLDYMGIEAGVRQEALLEAVAYVKKCVHTKLTGNMLEACKYKNI